MSDRIVSTMSKLPPGRYEAIFGHAEPTAKRGTYVLRDGELVRGHVVKDDAHNLRSLGLGVSLDQIPEATKLYRGKGVTFDPVTGDAIFRDRNARIQHLKDRGWHCKDEVRG